MDRYKKTMDRIELSAEADEKIRREILLAASEQRKENVIIMKPKHIRRFSAASVAAAMALTVGVTAFAATAIRIGMKNTENGDTASVSYAATDTSYIDLGIWIPQHLPKDNTMDFVSDPFYGSQTITYTNAAGSTIRYMYAKPDGFGGVDMEQVLKKEDVQVNGCKGILYTQKASSSLFWTNDTAGIGYWLSSDDPAVNLLEIAESVSRVNEAPAITNATWREDALTELGDHSLKDVPDGYHLESTTGSPTSEGGGWYGFVRKRYTNKGTNSAITLSYETYRLTDSLANTDENVLALSGLTGEKATVNGMAAVLSEDGSTLFWANVSDGLIFTLNSDSLTGTDLIKLANTVQ